MSLYNGFRCACQDGDFETVKFYVEELGVDKLIKTGLENTDVREGLSIATAHRIDYKSSIGSIC